MFGFAEDSVRQKVKEEISRGKVDVFIGVNVTAGSDMKISLNRPVLEGYLSAMKTIAADYEVKDDISVSSLTHFSDIFVVEKQEEDEQQATRQILTVVSQALESTPPCARPREQRWKPTSEAERRPCLVLLKKSRPEVR